MKTKTYIVYFEIESDRPAGEIAGNIRSALERSGFDGTTISGIDVDVKPKSARGQG
jgi:hypothetical protein